MPTLIHPAYASLNVVRPTTQQRPAANTVDPAWLRAEAAWLTDVDKSAAGIKNSIDAIRNLSAYQQAFPDNWPLKEIEKLPTALYSRLVSVGPNQLATQPAPSRLADDAEVLRATATQMETLANMAAQVPALQQQIAQLQQQIAQLQQRQQQQQPVVVPAAQQRSGTDWTTLLVSAGILAVLGVGAWYVMTHRRKPAEVREPQEPTKPVKKVKVAQSPRRLFPPM